MSIPKNKSQSDGGKKSKRAISPDEQTRLQRARLVAREKKAKLIAEAIKSWGPGKYKKVAGIVFIVTDGHIPREIQKMFGDGLAKAKVENATPEEFMEYYVERFGSLVIGPDPDMSERKMMEKTPERRKDET